MRFTLIAAPLLLAASSVVPAAAQSGALVITWTKDDDPKSDIGYWWIGCRPEVFKYCRRTCGQSQYCLDDCQISLQTWNYVQQPTRGNTKSAKVWCVSPPVTKAVLVKLKWV